MTHTTQEQPNFTEISSCLIKLQEKMQRVIFALMNSEQGNWDNVPDQVEQYLSTWQEYQQTLFQDPGKIVEYQIDMWNSWMKLYADTTRSWLQGDMSKLEKICDKRFIDDDWQAHPLFYSIKHFYLTNARLLLDFIKNDKNLAEDLKLKISFYTQQLIDAFSPTNFVLSNPKILRETIDSCGENLLKGLDQLLDDIESGRGHVAMTNFSAFTVGENLACTPGTVVYRNELMELIQYTPLTKQVCAAPLLMVPPCINKYYILDLSARNSMVRWLLENGHQVFMISWRNPDRSMHDTSFADYVLKGPLRAINYIREIYQGMKINAFGFCIGGTILAMAASYLAKQKRDYLNSCTFLTTLLDYSDPGDIKVFMDEAQVALLVDMAEKQGYIDGYRMAAGFSMLRPNDLIWNNYVRNYLHGEKPHAFDILYWNSDSTNLPATMYSQYLRWLYLENALIQPNRININGSTISLADITVPCYFLGALRDHIAPWKTCYKGMRETAGEKVFTLTKSGHIAGVINPPVNDKYHYTELSVDADDPESLLESAQWQHGSWWSHWLVWLNTCESKSILAIKPQHHLGAAPGEYVRAQVGEILLRDAQQLVNTTDEPVQSK